jgi:DNA-binding transcriptional LysR family regulator
MPDPTMTDFQIQCFLYLAAYQNFTRAAEVLGISQPALSRQIAALEKGLGMELFQRTHHGIVLTQEGRIMYSAFKETEKKILQAIDRARNISARDASILYLGVNEDWRMDGFMGALIEKCLAYQDLFQLEVRQLGSRDLSEALQEGTIDILLGLDTRLIAINDTDCYPVIGAHEYILYSPDQIHTQPESLDAFRDQTFILISQDQDNEFRVDQLAACLGFRPGQTIFVNSAEAQYLSVKCGMGLALVSELSRNFGRPDMACFDTGQTSQMVILSKPNSDNSRLIDIFIHTIASQMRVKQG